MSKLFAQLSPSILPPDAFAPGNVQAGPAQNTILEAGQVYLLKGHSNYTMSFDLDPSFLEGERTVWCSYDNPLSEWVNRVNCSYFRREIDSVIVKPRIDLRCRLFEVDVQKLQEVKMKNWKNSPTKNFYPVAMHVRKDSDIHLRMSRAALGRGRVSLLEGAQAYFSMEIPRLTDGTMRFVIKNPAKGYVRLWPVWAPLPEGYRMDYRLTAFGGYYYLTRPREEVSSSTGVHLDNYGMIPKFNRLAVVQGVADEALSKNTVRFFPEWHTDKNYCGMTFGHYASRFEPRPYELLKRIMESVGIKVVEDIGEAIDEQFSSINLTSAQVESIMSERDHFLSSADQYVFKFHLEVPDDKRIVFFHSFLQEIFRNQELVSKTHSFKLLHQDRTIAGESIIQPLFVLYPLAGVEAFIDVARMLRNIVERLDLPSSGAAPRFSLPIEPTNRLFMVHGGGNLKLSLEKKGLLDTFFDSAVNYALPHMVTRDPSSPIMKFLND